MNERITLTKAIEAYERGLRQLNADRDHWRDVQEKAQATERSLTTEINLRANVLTAMQRLQEYYGNTETITMFVPVDVPHPLLGKTVKIDPAKIPVVNNYPPFLIGAVGRVIRANPENGLVVVRYPFDPVIEIWADPAHLTIFKEHG